MSRRTCRCGRCRARPTRCRNCGTATACAGRSKTPRSSRCRIPGGLPDGVHEVSIELRLRMSYIPVEHQPSTYTVTKHVTLSPEATGAPFKYGVSPLQLHDRLRHRARPRDRDGRHRRHRRDRHRDPRRGAHPELPEPVAGVGGRLVPAAGEVRPRAHQLRLVDRHPPALQRPERPRHDRRRGRRGAAARPPAREAARVPVRPPEDRRRLERPGAAPDLDRGRRGIASRWPKSST